MDEIDAALIDDEQSDQNTMDECGDTGTCDKEQELGFDEGDGRWPFSRRPVKSTDPTPASVPVETKNSSIERVQYNMNHPRRGIFIIISNRVFNPNTKQKERVGTEADAANLYTQFKSLGFECRIGQNKTTTEMLKIFKDASEEDHSDADCFACAILSHGDMGIVYGIDGIVPVEVLTSFFKGPKCISLAGKPKLFFIQACRGHKLDEGVMVADGGSDRDYVKRIPSEADFLLAYSTVPGYFSWRNTRSGSWFVQALCQVLNQKGVDSMEMMQLLTQVNRLVAFEFESRIHDDPLWDKKKQVPAIVSMLTKELYLTKK